MLTGCLDEVRALAFVGGQLAPAQRSTIEDHVDDCDSCRQVLAALVRTDVAPPASGWQPGRRIGRYVIREPIGRGGMGAVFRADDVELGRSVALKRLHPGGDVDVRARLMREARSAAQLSHPNVVTVYEVGDDDGTPFLAMELVDGDTLTAWLRVRPRDWRESVGVMAQAGRGLAAAHARGLVHRDFKPDNVLIDRGSGAEVPRARVVDFGLARDALDQVSRDAPANSRPALALGRLTATGALAGTPAYLAPELVAGGAPDARSDQFAFAVSLFEAVHGSHPFSGRTAPELWAEMAAGRIRETSDRVPAWLARAIRRGLAADPSVRWPSVGALVSAIAPRGRRVWPLIAAAGVAVVGATVAVVVVSQRGPSATVAATAPSPAEACEHTTDQMIAGTWGGPVRELVVGQFNRYAAAAPQLTTVVATTTSMLDDWAATWRRDRNQACAIEPARRAPRLDCLDRAVGELNQLRLAWVPLRRGLVEDSASAVAALPRPDDCTEHAVATVSRPELDWGIAALLAFDRTGQPQDGERRIARVLADADATSDPATIARATRAAASIERALGKLDPAREHAVRSASEAARAGDDIGMVDALVLEAGIAIDQSRPLDALGLVDAAAAIVVRSKVDRETQVQMRRGDVLAHLGRTPESIIAYQRAIAALEPRASRDRAARIELASVLGALGSSQGEQYKLDDAVASLSRALAIEEAELGHDHPEVGKTLHELASQELELGKLDDAGVHLERSRAILVAAYGEHHRLVAGSDITLGELAWRRHNCDAARGHWEHARDELAGIARPGDPFLATIEESIGACDREQDRSASAVEHYQRALEIFETGGIHGQALANAQIEYGMALADVKRYVDARVVIERGLAELDKAGATAVSHISGWEQLAEIEAHQHNVARAIELENQAIAAIGDDPRPDFAAERKADEVRVRELAAALRK